VNRRIKLAVPKEWTLRSFARAGDYTVTLFLVSIVIKLLGKALTL
jgi:hypothetical protein